eukprot:12987750-Alexandrium_andersonii.AAC.1
MQSGARAADTGSQLSEESVCPLLKSGCSCLKRPSWGALDMLVVCFGWRQPKLRAIREFSARAGP